MKRIEVTIGADGKIKIEALGFKGRECIEATKALEQALGAADHRTSKPEMYQSTAGVSAKVKG